MQDANHLDINLGKPQPSGLGGWLALPSIGLLVSPFIMAKMVYETYVPLMKMEVLTLLANTQLPSYNPRLLPVLGVELFINIAFFLFTLAIIPQFFRKKATAPKLMVIWYASAIAIQIVDVILTAYVDPKTGIDPDLSKAIIKTTVIAFIWIPYFMQSVRVKNTFGQNAFSKTGATENIAALPT
jgi:hypothetical protein